MMDGIAASDQAQIIQRLHEHAQAAAALEVDKTLRKLGHAPELEPRLREMADRIVMTLLASATERLRTPEVEPAVLDAAIEIFALAH